MSSEELHRLRELHHAAQIAKLQAENAELKLRSHIEVCLARRRLNNDARIHLEDGSIS